MTAGGCDQVARRQLSGGGACAGGGRAGECACMRTAREIFSCSKIRRDDFTRHHRANEGRGNCHDLVRFGVLTDIETDLFLFGTYTERHEKIGDLIQHVGPHEAEAADNHDGEEMSHE